MSAGIPILATGWILWPIVLFSISGIVFGARVAPLQGKILRLSAACGESPGAWQAYADAYRAWELWGLLALVTPAASVVIMVLKPTLPGL
jgi:uncharacterized membrane protein